LVGEMRRAGKGDHADGFAAGGEGVAVGAPGG
jgi:hypothetical protein